MVVLDDNRVHDIDKDKIRNNWEARKGQKEEFSDVNTLEKQ